MTSGLQESWAALAPAVNETLGPVLRVQRGRPFAGEPAFAHYTATLAEVQRVCRLPLFYRYGGGTSLHEDHARLRALGEALERYCSFFRAPTDVVTGSYDELLHGNALSVEPLNPRNLPRCSDDEYEQARDYLRPPRPDVAVPWRLGQDLTAGRPILLPADLCDMHPANHSLDQVWALPISTGLALGLDPDSAALRAGLEVVERDAFTITWYLQLRVGQFDLDSIDDSSVIGRVAAIQAAGLSVRLHLLPCELEVPVVLAELRSRQAPAVIVGCAAETTLALATAKALDEAVGTRRYALSCLLGGWTPKYVLDAPRTAVSLEDHLFAYSTPGTESTLDFLSDGPLQSWAAANRATASAPRSLAELLGAARRAGQVLAACDLTTDDVADLGVVVVRVLAPGLEPLSQDHNVRYLGRDRLARLAVKHRALSALIPPATVTDLPHPFA